MLSAISQAEKDKYLMMSLICGILKIQPTNEYNKKRSRLTDIEKKPVVTSGRALVGFSEVQTVMYKIRYKDILYNIENIANTF